MPHAHMVDPLGDNNLLVDTAGQEVLIGIPRFIAAERSHMTFWIFEHFFHKEIKSILFRHGICIIDADIVHRQSVI